MSTKRIVCLFVILWGAALFSAGGFCQNVNISASGPSVVGVGQQFTVTFTVNAQVDNIKPPSFKDFDFLGGPSKSISNFFSSANGQVQQSTNISFTYYLRAKTEGIFSVLAASCQVDGKTYESNALTVRVEKGGGSPAQTQPQTRQQTQQPQGQTTLDENSIFVRAAPSKNNAAQGEQVIITYKIYTLVPLSQYQILKLPANKGFWVEELDNNKQDRVKQSTENYNGRTYSVAEIRKIAIFPQESGRLSIDPLELDVIAQLQAPRRSTGSIFDLFDDPFFAQVQQVKKTLRSNPVTITVEPLPSKPQDFAGAVGTFTQQTSVDRQKVRANEAFTYKMTISGKGNIMLIDKPVVNFPQGFEVYEPKTSLNLSKSDAGVSGSKTFEWILIPRSEGKYVIPSATFTFYDPTTKRFVDQKTNEYAIEVEKGDPNSSAVLSSSNKQEVKLLNSDIEYIKDKSVKLHPKNKSFFRSDLFWILLIIPFVLATACILLLRSIMKSRNNVSAMRLKRATSVARKRLKKAEKFLENKDVNGFYVEISQAMWGYLSDKFNISQAKLSMDSIQESLAKKNVNQEIIAQIMNALNDCEYARFAPGDTTENMDKLYHEAIHVITKVENELK